MCREGESWTPQFVKPFLALWRQQVYVAADEALELQHPLNLLHHSKAALQSNNYTRASYSVLGRFKGRHIHACLQ